MILQRVGVPIYLQVKNYILEKIKSGDYQPGDKIPTERELSKELGISRSTVSVAYKELLLEDVLEARQGRGTFVKVTAAANGNTDEIAGGKRERLMKVIDDAMVKALELGFTLDQFAAIASIRAKEKTETVKQLRVAVVGCALEFIQRFIGQIGQMTNVQLEPVVLSEVTEGKIPAEFLRACDMIITTSEHSNVLAEIIGSANKITTVSTVPNLEAMIKLARLTADTEVGIVARSKAFCDKLEELLKRTAIHNLKFNYLHYADTEDIRQFALEHKVLVASEEYEHVVKRCAPINHEVITFYYEIDQGSLKQMMLTLTTQAR